MCQASLTLTQVESNCGRWELFMSDRNAFTLNFLKFRVSTYLELRLGIPILRMAKTRLWSPIGREYRMHNTLRIISNKEVNQMLLVILVGSLITCVNWYASIILMSRVVYESLQSLVTDYNLYRQLCRYPSNLIQPALTRIQKHQKARQVNEVVDTTKVSKMARNLVC